MVRFRNPDLGASVKSNKYNAEPSGRRYTFFSTGYLEVSEPEDVEYFYNNPSFEVHPDDLEDAEALIKGSQEPDDKAEEVEDDVEEQVDDEQEEESSEEVEDVEEVSEEEPEENEEDDDGPEMEEYPSPLEMTANEVEEYVSTVEDIEALENFLQLEEEGQDRKTAAGAIENRIKHLEELENEE